MTIEDLFERFFEYKKPTCKGSTLGNYRVMFNKLCRTGIVERGMDASALDSGYLQTVYDKCKASGLSEKTARDTCTLIKNIINTGSGLGLYQARMLQVRYTREGYIQNERLKVYHNDEIRKIFGWVDNNPHFWTLAIYIGVYTGARIGEICGLKWTDVDFQEKTIHVQRTVERSAAMEGKGTVIYINTTKTKSSNRLLPLGKELERKLKDWSRVSRPEFYILSNSRDVIEPRLIRERLRKMCEITGVRYKGFHSLRHTFATNMLENGADIKTISDILGHSSVEITMDIYSHPSDTSKRNTVNKVFRKLKFE